MASVAKWLRQWIVVPPLGGSIPLVRPTVSLEDSKQVETFRRSFLNTGMKSRLKVNKIRLVFA